MNIRTSAPGLLKDRGSATAEFAVTCVLLVMLLLGIVEMSRMVLVYTTISNAARIGARYAVVHGSDNSVTTSTITSFVNGYLAIGMVNSANATVTVNYPDSGSTNPPCASPGNEPGCRVTVSISYPYDPFTSYFPLTSLTFTSTSEGVITF